MSSKHSNNSEMWTFEGRDKRLSRVKKYFQLLASGVKWDEHLVMGGEDTKLHDNLDKQMTGIRIGLCVMYVSWRHLLLNMTECTSTTNALCHLDFF